MTELHEIEQNIKQCEEILADRPILERLYKNKDFKKIIIEGYLEKESNRIVGMMADSRYREEAASMLTGMAHLRKHLNTLNQFFDQAEAQLKELEEARIEALTDGE